MGEPKCWRCDAGLRPSVVKAGKLAEHMEHDGGYRGFIRMDHEDMDGWRCPSCEIFYIYDAPPAG